MTKPTVITVHHRVFNVGQFTFQGDLIQEYRFEHTKEKGMHHYSLLNPTMEIQKLLSKKHLKCKCKTEMSHKDLVGWMHDLREAVAEEKDVLYDRLHIFVKKFNKRTLVKMLEIIDPNVYIEDYYSRAELLDCVIGRQGLWYKVQGIKGLDPRTFNFKVK